MWLTTPGAYWFVVLTAVVGFALPGYVVALVLLALLHRGAPGEVRRWYAGGAVLALAGTVFQVVIAAPAFVGGHASGDADLSVMTLSLREGRADAAETVALADSREIDVLVLQEVTPDARERLRSAGLDDLLPYVGGAARDGSSGTMVFSAHPLSGERALASRNGAFVLLVDAPRRPFHLIAVHTSQPLELPAEWAKDWRAVNAAAGDLSGARLVVGDLNATLDHRPVRDLLATGLADAAERANAGWQPTWPGLPGLAGLVTIDHVLHSGAFDTISTSTERVAGTDHRALIAALVLGNG